MAINQQPITTEQYETFVNLPENVDRLFELIGGEIIDVFPYPYTSYIAATFIGYIFGYLMKNDIGWCTGKGGGYQVAGERYAPDAAFVSYVKQKSPVQQGYNPNPPDLAVEVVSSDSRIENEILTIKLGNYLSVGTIVWIVRPDKGYIEVHETGQKVKKYRQGDTISGGDLLPDFQVAVSDILKKPSDE